MELFNQLNPSTFNVNREELEKKLRETLSGIVPKIDVINITHMVNERINELKGVLKQYINSRVKKSARSCL